MDSLESLGPVPKRARVEIIPLIDVIFFLLATFVLFTLSLQKIWDVRADLPRGEIAGERDETTVFVQVSAGGMCYWKKGASGTAEPISSQELRPRIEDFARSEREPRVFIRSDRNARLGDA